MIQSADKVANTASVYGAYLKSVKNIAQKPLDIRLNCEFVSSTNTDVFCMDSTFLLKYLSDKPLDFVYLDPPYNIRQYCANYHLLETIAKWDLSFFTPRGKTGLRPTALQKSRFSMRKQVMAGFFELFSSLSCQYGLLSYNNEGLLTESDLREVMGSRFEILSFDKVPYHRFQSDAASLRQIKANNTTEWLILFKSICL